MRQIDGLLPLKVLWYLPDFCSGSQGPHRGGPAQQLDNVFGLADPPRIGVTGWSWTDPQLNRVPKIDIEEIFRKNCQFLTTNYAKKIHPKFAQASPPTHFHPYFTHF